MTLRISQKFVGFAGCLTQRARPLHCSLPGHGATSRRVPPVYFTLGI